MPSITQKLDELIKVVGGDPSGNGLPIDRKIEQAAEAIKNSSDAKTRQDLEALDQRVTGQINTINGEITVLDSRVDAIASLPDGSTSGDAELIDIRVGADGTTYDSAGNAVRGQIGDLKSAIDYSTDSINHDLVLYAVNGLCQHSTYLTVNQTNNRITLNGKSNATSTQSTTKILLSGHLESWNATTVPESADVYTVKLLKGHRYKIRAEVISGTRDKTTGTGSLLFRLFNSSGQVFTMTLGINDSAIEDFYTSDGTPIAVRMQWARLLECTNVVIDYTIQDVTIEQTFVNKDNIDLLFDNIGKNQRNILSGYTKNHYWNSTTSTATDTEYSSYYAFAPIPVSEGDNITVKIYSGHSTQQDPVLIVDDSYAILKRYTGTRDANNTFEFTCPANSAYILLTTQGSAMVNAVECYKTTINNVSDFFAFSRGVFSYNGKTVAIIGDSISTNGNYSEINPFGNVPEIVIGDEDIGVALSAYPTYYDIGTIVGGHEIVASDVGVELQFTPVSGDEGKIVGKPYNRNAASVKTWWEVASEVLGFTPIPVAWSGSSITSHEGNESTYKTSYAWHPAQIRKCGVRTPGTMTRTAPDMVIIYRGTNDMTHSPYTRISNYLEQYPVDIPTVDTFDDGGTTRYDYIRGLLLTIAKIQEAYPSAKIVLCTFNYFHRLSSSYAGYPSRNGINTIYQYNNAIREVANYTGCDLIEFDKDGLTYANASSVYYQDSSPDFVHPTTAGHAIMGNRAICDLAKINDIT